MKDSKLGCQLTHHNELCQTLLKVHGQMLQFQYQTISSQKMKEQKMTMSPPTQTTGTHGVKGRQETLSPTPQVPQTVRSAIELTVKDFEPSEQRIIDKCGEVDLQLSNHRDWQQPNSQLSQDICDLLPILYQSGFNTEGFPTLKDYLYQTVGTLPCQSLLR